MKTVDVVEIKNGFKVRGTFSSAEMQRRMASLRLFMGTSDIDAILFISPHNINYYSDLFAYSMGRHYGLAVTQQHSTTISPSIAYGQPYRRSFGENLVYTDWEPDGFFRAAKRLLSGMKRIGIEFDQVTLELRRKLEEIVPGAELVDVGAAVRRTRLIKSAEEIELVRIGARVAEVGATACLDLLEEGLPEHEAALASTNAMVREIARRLPHAEIRGTWTWFQSATNTDGAFTPTTTRRIQRGDILGLKCFPAIAGYCTALERTLFLGEPSPRARALWEANCGVYRQALECIRPGVRCSAIAQDIEAFYAEAGLLDFRGAGYGHCFGAWSQAQGLETSLELRRDEDTLLEPGMLVSLEPTITVPYGADGAGGYRENNLVIVGEKGGECLLAFPVGPTANTVSCPGKQAGAASG